MRILFALLKKYKRQEMFYKKNSIVHNSTLEKELFLFVLFYGENVFLRYLRVRCFFVQTAIRVHTTTFIIIL